MTPQYSTSVYLLFARSGNILSVICRRKSGWLSGFKEELMAVHFDVLFIQYLASEFYNKNKLCWIASPLSSSSLTRGGSHRWQTSQLTSTCTNTGHVQFLARDTPRDKQYFTLQRDCRMRFLVLFFGLYGCLNVNRLWFLNFNDVPLILDNYFRFWRVQAKHSWRFLESR
jgi:hypothetical protein